MLDKSLLRTGQCILVHSHKFLGKGIQEFEQDRYNHAGMLVFDAGEWWVSEERSITGIGFTKLDEFLVKGNEYLIREPMNMCVYNPVYIQIEVLKLCLEYANSGLYDWRNTFIKQPIRYISKMLNKLIGWPKHEIIINQRIRDGVFQCAGWVSYIYCKVFKIFHNWYDMSPADLHTSTLLVDIQKFKHE